MIKNQNDYEYLVKYLIIGYSVKAKSELLLGCFNEDISTIGVEDFKSKSLNIEGKLVRTLIWDTSDQERYKDITNNYYQGFSGVILVYDVANAESFNKLRENLIEIEKNAPKSIYKILVGNLTDISDHREVSYDQGKVSNNHQ